MPHTRQPSWPPVQVRLHNNIERGDPAVHNDDDFMEDDPMTYFLTPTPLLEIDDDEDMDDFIGFDAGIEDAKHPPEIVRSVSPSSLDGLSLPPPRPPTPPRSPPAHLPPDPESATDEDDDGEDYIRFGVGRGHHLGLPFNLKDWAAFTAKSKGKAKATTTNNGKALAAGLLSPSSSPPAQYSPKPSSRGRSGARGRSQPIRRRSPHAWREPSPDVFSIEEETEAEVTSEMGSSVGAMEDLDLDMETRMKALEETAAKPKKRVRFVLPVKD